MTKKFLGGPAFSRVLRDGIDTNVQVPLYLCIQIQSKPLAKFNKKLNDLTAKSSLAIIDQRRFHHTNAQKKLVSAELYVQDTKGRVNLLRYGIESDENQSVLPCSFYNTIVSERGEELREKMLRILGNDFARVKVQQWHPHKVQLIGQDEPYDLSREIDIYNLILF